MNDISFDNLTDLYNRLYPAFLTKVSDFKRYNIIVSSSDLWNYFKDNIWINSYDLKLYQMVDDILKLDIAKFLESRKTYENR